MRKSGAMVILLYVLAGYALGAMYPQLFAATLGKVLK